MKKIYLFTLLLFSLFSFAQNGITYQAVILNPKGEELPGADNSRSPLVNQTICLRFKIVKPGNLIEYQETQVTSTDEFGMVNLIIGTGIQTGGTAANFTAVTWDGNPKNLIVELDAEGTCNNFIEISNQPFTYVPYAYYASNSGTPGPTGPAGPQGPIGLTGPTGPAGTFQNGNNNGDMFYWNGSNWVILPIGSNGQNLTVCNGVPIWGPCIIPSSNGSSVITSFNSCSIASVGTLTSGVPVSGVTQTINVTVGTIGTYSISATANGVTFAASGTFTTTGAQDIILTATGIPIASGNNTFTLNTTPGCSFSLNTIPLIMIDIDGNNYQTFQICNQIWSQSNLNVSHYRNGDVIPQVTDPTQWANLTTGAWCYYDNDPANGANYGKMYNWYAVNDPRGLAPQGWHVPTDAEWTTLINCLGGESVAGGKMKSTGTTLWQSPNTGATNSSRFTGLPGGQRNYFGNFETIQVGSWWSSSEIGNFAFQRSIFYDTTTVVRSGLGKLTGIYVRCVKD